ncbi:M81 family metallopeptidase [Lentilitoribacter sp. EG35]|jgi:microcystin degradation protein MlrC|uniref:M81 family metallopeptidase n=1 Tax=Lentilitoribacter sp. EG35 TaxID=3234192 RepID=UPI00345FD728
MGSKLNKIMVYRIWHESNTFNPCITKGTDFAFCEGEEMLQNALQAGSTLGGIIGGLKSKDCEVLPGFSLVGAPGGLVDHEFFETIWTRISKDVDRLCPNAIAIEFHGAMGTTELPDAEGELLSRLREKVGGNIKIGIGLDLHAHLTNAMISSVDICVACKENPHSDVVECGIKVADLLYATINGDILPTMCMIKVPMVLPGNAETTSGPLYDIHKTARHLQPNNKQILDISIFNMFPYVDDIDTGQAVLATYDELPTNTKGITEIAQKFWSSRQEFVDDLPDIKEALNQVATKECDLPLVLADMGDRVLAGAPGDSTVILKEVLSRSDTLTGAISITDPDAVNIAKEAGVGNQINIQVGGKLSPGLSSHEISASVIALSNGDFTIRGPFYGGEKSSLGETAVLLIDDRIQLVLTSKPALCHDPAVFTSQGINLSRLDFIVAKSGYHFKLNFADIAVPVVVRTPGVSYYAPSILPYKTSKFWPEQQTVSPDFEVRIFS